MVRIVHLFNRIADAKEPITQLVADPIAKMAMLENQTPPEH